MSDRSGVIDGASILASLDRAMRTLEAAGFAVDSARRDASLIARHVLHWDLAHWLGHQRDTAPAGFDAAFAGLIARRATREPVAYITGEREFYGRPFVVSSAVLIPRPETEFIVEAALEAAARINDAAPVVIDLGTGSGCVAITLAAELPRARVTATEISAPALAVARENAARLGVAERVAFREGAYFAGWPDAADIIVANLPYVAERDRPAMVADVVAHEPGVALFGGPDGLDCIRELLRLAPANLRPGGTLIFEFGCGQDDAVAELVNSVAALRLREIRNDLQGIPRVAIVTRSV